MIATSPEVMVRSSASVRDVDAKQGLLTAVVSTADVDQHDTVLLPQGCDYEHYMKTGAPVTWEHGKDRTRGYVPVANALAIMATNRGLEAEVQFRMNDPWSRDIFGCYEDGTIRSFSVEFIHAEVSKPTQAELKRRPDWARAYGGIIRRWTLAGLTACTVPSCPGVQTLRVRSLAYGINPVEELAAEIFRACSPLMARHLAELRVANAAQLQKETDERQGRNTQELFARMGWK